MINVSDKEYLSRPLLDVKFRITDTEVYVASEHTGYANMRKLERLLKEDILKLYSEIIKMAKSRGIKVSYKNHYKKFIEENWNSYRDELKHYNEIFGKAREKFLEVQKRGLHSGTSDDIVLKEALDLRNEFEKCYWRTSKVSQMSELYVKLNNYHRELQSSNCNYYMLYL